MIALALVALVVIYLIVACSILAATFDADEWHESTLVAMAWPLLAMIALVAAIGEYLVIGYRMVRKIGA